jgi:anti-anti-sigma factor
MRRAVVEAPRYEVRHWDAGAKAHVVVAAGEIDLHAAPALRETLTSLVEMGRADLVLDMTSATFIDSTAIGVLAGHLQRVRRDGGSLTVATANENVLRTLEIAGMARELDIRESLSDALAPVPPLRPPPSPVPAFSNGRRTLELRVAPEPSELARARGFAAAAARRFGLDPRERHDFMLAASEAVANAIEHGRPCYDDTIQLWVTEGGDTLTLGVRDAGNFILEPLPPDPLPERGRGLQLMSCLVDEVSLRQTDGHTQVELSKHR